MLLPDSWVEKIFMKLSVAYGRDFLGRWEGLELSLVKADWAHELSGYVDHPYALAYALDNMTASKPPTAKEFRAICNACPAPKLTALEAPAVKPSSEVMEKVSAVAANCHSIHPRDWARKLKAREEAGDKLTRAQREMWREALKEAVSA